MFSFFVENFEVWSIHVDHDMTGTFVSNCSLFYRLTHLICILRTPLTTYFLTRTLSTGDSTIIRQKETFMRNFEALQKFLEGHETRVEFPRVLSRK